MTLTWESRIGDEGCNIYYQIYWHNRKSAVPLLNRKRLLRLGNSFGASASIFESVLPPVEGKCCDKISITFTGSRDV